MVAMDGTGFWYACMPLAQQANMRWLCLERTLALHMSTKASRSGLLSLLLSQATQSRESSGAAHVGAQPAPHSSTSASLTQYATVAGSVLFSCSVALQRSAPHATPVTAAASAAGCDAAHARSARKSPRGRSGSQYLRAGRGSACAYLLMLLWL